MTSQRDSDLTSTIRSNTIHGKILLLIDGMSNNILEELQSTGMKIDDCTPQALSNAVYNESLRIHLPEIDENIVSIGITPAVKNKKQQKKEESDDDEPEQKKTPAVKKPVQKKGGCKANRM